MVSDKFLAIVVSGQEFYFYQISKKKKKRIDVYVANRTRRRRTRKYLHDNISLSVLPHETMNTEDPDRCADLSE